MNTILEKHRSSLVRLCSDHGIKRLSALGSVVREDFGSDSDVDLLVEFEDVDSPGYADRYLQFAQTAEVIFNRPVDLLTTKSLRNPYLKRRIAEEAVEVHASSYLEAIRGCPSGL